MLRIGRGNIRRSRTNRILPLLVKLAIPYCEYEASLAKAGTESDHKVIDPGMLDNQTPIKPRKI